MKALVKKSFKFVDELWMEYISCNKVDIRWDVTTLKAVPAMDVSVVLLCCSPREEDVSDSGEDSADSDSEDDPLADGLRIILDHFDDCCEDEEDEH